MLRAVLQNELDIAHPHAMFVPPLLNARYSRTRRRWVGMAVLLSEDVFLVAGVVITKVYGSSTSLLNPLTQDADQRSEEGILLLFRHSSKGRIPSLEICGV